MISLINSGEGLDPFPRIITYLRTYFKEFNKPFLLMISLINSGEGLDPFPQYYNVLISKNSKVRSC